MTMDGLLSALIAVGLAAIGDRTQLLGVLLAARWRRPGAVILGMVAATLLAQGLSAWGGLLIAGSLAPRATALLLALGFLVMGAWSFVPERLPKDADATSRLGPALASAAAFFAVEFGDRTQLATMALAARFGSATTVTLGATLGLAAAVVPCILFGEAATKRLPLRALRLASAALFIALGLWTGLGALRLI